MGTNHRGRQSLVFEHPPVILASSAIGGKKEAEGPLAEDFDYLDKDTTFRQASWEKAECTMQEMALQTAKEKAGLKDQDLDAVLAGDLLNQCITSSFAVRNTGVPFLGLYGACSTMAESLLLGSCLVSSGFARVAAAISSSHFASAERQYRFPLGYGGQRTPTAQWTVTGAGCILLGQTGSGPVVDCATMGTVVDYGISDANHMGAAMAPAAYETIRAHFDELSRSPEDYDLIVTGDLGRIGKDLLLDLFRKDGVCLDEVYDDCGTMIFHSQKQDVHAGGSGCGCGSVVLCGHLLRQMARGTLRSILFCGTGALMSPLSSQQGESIPAICHAVSIRRERN